MPAVIGLGMALRLVVAFLAHNLLHAAPQNVGYASIRGLAQA
jgi:hypothetical protein